MRRREAAGPRYKNMIMNAFECKLIKFEMKSKWECGSGRNLISTQFQSISWPNLQPKINFTVARRGDEISHAKPSSSLPSPNARPTLGACCGSENVYAKNYWSIPIFNSWREITQHPTLSQTKGGRLFLLLFPFFIVGRRHNAAEPYFKFILKLCVVKSNNGTFQYTQMNFILFYSSAFSFFKGWLGFFVCCANTPNTTQPPLERPSVSFSGFIFSPMIFHISHWIKTFTTLKKVSAFALLSLSWGRRGRIL